jgi:2'-5' RNA ligase
MKDPLFFIAVLPPQDIRDEVTAFKQHIADTWGPRHAFKSPPHLTLQPPFPWPPAELPRLQRTLADYAATQTPFEVELRNFAAFAPRVVFVHPVKSAELEALYHGLLARLDRDLDFRDPRNDRPFNPHMTIAHRDVPEERFAAIWGYFKEQRYERRFEIAALTLLKSVQGKWQVLENYPFK